MEADKFKQNETLFIISITSLVLSLSLFALAFYILPHLIWNLNYNIPGFVFTWIQWLIENYSFTEAGASAMAFFIFFIPAIITGLISYMTSSAIENKVLGITPEKPLEEEEHVDLKETFSLGMKLLILIVMVIVAVLVIEWIIAVPTPKQEFV